jgi:hypothetical protein
MEEERKFYSQRVILIATFLGSPAAAGILIRRNFLSLGKEKQGFNALIIGIISTILLFVVLFLLPEPIIDKIPNVLIPLMYTGIIYFIVEKTQGEALREHQENNNLFYSVWRSVAIGFACSIVLLSGIFIYAYYASEDWNTTEYDAGIEKISKNEQEAMRLFDMLDKNPKEDIVHFIEQTGIPRWQESIEILNDLNNIENIPEEYKQQNKLLLEYCKLRIESYNLLLKSVQEETLEYDDEIIEKHIRIEQIIDRL